MQFRDNLKEFWTLLNRKISIFILFIQDFWKFVTKWYFYFYYLQTFQEEKAARDQEQANQAAAEPEVTETTPDDFTTDISESTNETQIEVYICSFII